MHLGLKFYADRQTDIAVATYCITPYHWHTLSVITRLIVHIGHLRAIELSIKPDSETIVNEVTLKLLSSIVFSPIQASASTLLSLDIFG
jgi:hypothetical protein